jgi:hypothetical protein
VQDDGRRAVATAAREAPKLRRLTITPQPDDVSCGPACLEAVYRHHGVHVPLGDLLRDVPPLHNGGRLAVQLGIHALDQGLRVRLFTYNLEAFDPTWFGRPPEELADRLRAQRRVKTSRRLREATELYLAFLERGGRIEHELLTQELLAGFLDEGLPLLAGVCATYLYGCPREVGDVVLSYDDVRGRPTGHFVVLYGHDDATRTMHVADPAPDNPRFGSHHYAVGVERVIGAMLLGAFTWDANFLVVEPGNGSRA